MKEERKKTFCRDKGTRGRGKKREFLSFLSGWGERRGREREGEREQKPATRAKRETGEGREGGGGGGREESIFFTKVVCNSIRRRERGGGRKRRGEEEQVSLGPRDRHEGEEGLKYIFLEWEHNSCTAVGGSTDCTIVGARRAERAAIRYPPPFWVGLQKGGRSPHNLARVVVVSAFCLVRPYLLPCRDRAFS